MIGFIEGTVKAVHKNYLIVATDQVGYKVFVIPPMLLSAEVGKPLELYIHTYVREDQLSLYGFNSIAELDFFEMLIGISGIGPKMAMSIMSLADLEMIKGGIASGDASVFIKVSGVGKKTAERLIVELKEKIGEVDGDLTEVAQASREHADVLDVLLALGYSRKEAQQAVGEIPKNLTESNDKIREALRALAKQ